MRTTCLVLTDTALPHRLRRLKHRLNLEHVSGLSQQAVVQDVAAKIMCGNLQTLVVDRP